MEFLSTAATATWSTLLQAAVPSAALLREFCEHTGMRWGPTPHNLFWYRSPELHIVEFFAFLAVILVAKRLSAGLYASVVTQQRPVRNPDSAFDLALGVTLAGCWLSQVLFKAVRPNPLVQLCWLFMPCHVITLVWVYVLLSKGHPNYRLCVYLATISGAFHWGPAGAAAFPDWSDHNFSFEGKVFVLHHGILVVMPFYWAIRYDLVPMTPKLLLHMVWTAVAINTVFYQLLSYVSGLNVNYQLHPPPQIAHWPIMATVYYRWIVISILTVLSFFLWCVLKAVQVVIGRQILRIKSKLG